MNTPPDPLEPIRQAVRSGEFDRAQLLWNECAAGLAAELSGGSLSAARLSEVRDLVEWARVVILCDRSHMQQELNTLHVAAEYEKVPPQPTHRLVEASL